MKVNITMPDSLFEEYVVKFGLPAAYAKMREAIEAFRSVKKDDRIVMLAGDERRAIEAVFQTTVDDAKKLVRLCQNMNTVKVGGVEMAFSADQLERLAAQASFYGRTTQEYIREQVDEIKAAMLEKV